MEPWSSGLHPDVWIRSFLSENTGSGEYAARWPRITSPHRNTEAYQNRTPCEPNTVFIDLICLQNTAVAETTPLIPFALKHYSLSPISKSFQAIMTGKFIKQTRWKALGTLVSFLRVEWALGRISWNTTEHASCSPACVPGPNHTQTKQCVQAKKFIKSLLEKNKSKRLTALQGKASSQPHGTHTWFTSTRWWRGSIATFPREAHTGMWFIEHVTAIIAHGFPLSARQHAWIIKHCGSQVHYVHDISVSASSFR